jgi:hypothetical protein
MNTVFSQNKEQFKRLRIFNLVMGFFHFAQGVIMLLISSEFTQSLTTNFLDFDVESRTATNITEEVFDVNLAPFVALFLFISAFFHFLLGTVAYKWYVKNLKQNINYARWYEYSISSSIMIVLIGVLVGIFDVFALLMLFSLNASMNLFGLLMEKLNQYTKKTNWLPFIYGVFAGIIPWVVIAAYFIGAVESVGDIIPDFVYGILISIFVFFNIFAINMYLQYQKIGPWKNYLFGETMYIVLSLVAKSALAWQVWSGTLR